MIPILCVVGKSNSGKTTLLANLIPELKSMGFKVAVVKHVPHGSDLDVHGKDSWRLLNAGSAQSLVSGPRHVAQFLNVEGDTTLRDLIPMVWDCDVLLAEGYKESIYPKVEVVRKDFGAELVSDKHQLVAVVSEAEIPVSVPKFRPSETEALAKFIAETYIIPSRQETGTVLIINGVQIPLKPFAEHFFARAILGMATSLKGIDGVERLTVHIRNSGGEEKSS